MLSTLDKSMKAKQSRIQEVRKQETEWSKKNVHDFKREKIEAKTSEERERAHEEYLRLIESIEKAKLLKEQALIEIGEAQRRAEEQRQFSLQQEQLRQMKLEQTQKMAQSRFKEAQEWKKQTWAESEEGRHAGRLALLKETSMIEKQREQSLLQSFKQDQTTIKDYNILLDKSKKSTFKPEDFSKTCFHNPITVKHDQDEQKENAIDRANSLFIESQSQLEQTAKLWRDQEKQQRERGRKAISKERQKKVLEEIEHDTKFLKQHQLEENIKSMKTPFLKKPTQTKSSQDKLSQEFNKMFVDKGVGEWKDSSQKKAKRKERSTSASKERPKSKSVKIFTKKPLDSGLYKTTENTDRVDYTEYPLASPDQQETADKRKVTFQVPELGQSNRSQSEGLVQEFKQSKDKLNTVVQQQEQMQQQIEEEEEEDSEIVDETPRQDQVESSEASPHPQVSDMKAYIREQERYLIQLEEERQRITKSMNQEEHNLMRTLRETNKMINQHIPEEASSQASEQEDINLGSSGVQFEGSGNTYKNLYETDDQSQLTSNPSYINPQQQFNVPRFTQRNGSPESSEPSALKQPNYGHQYTFQNPLQLVSSPQRYTEGSPSAYEYSPESKDQSGRKNDNFDTSEVMKRFLKPTGNQQNALEPLNRFIQNKQLQQQLRNASPESELSCTISEQETKSNEKTKQFNNQAYIFVQEELNESPHFDEELPKSRGYDQVDQQQEGSLGEIFQRRKAELSRKFQEKKQEEKPGKVEKTKQELQEIRKQMMKRQKKEEQSNPEPVEPPPPDKKTQLMQRLATGTRVQVDKQEMLSLTAKNYEQLPEVQRRKIDQEKKDEFRRRQEKVKELDQKTRQKFKQ